MECTKKRLFYHGEIENFQIKENDHVKEIFNSINNFLIEIMKLNKIPRFIVGLSYVGLPLALLFKNILMS